MDIGPTAPRRAANGGLAASGRAAQLPRRAVTFYEPRTTPDCQTRSGVDPAWLCHGHGRRGRLLPPVVPRHPVRGVSAAPSS